MTLANWNSKDYQVDFPDIVVAPGTRQVDLPLTAKVFTIVSSLLGKILPEAQKATMNGFALAGLFIALAAIDYLAGYCVGRETTGENYKSFMRKYFPEEYHPYLDAIYRQLRCGLMHNLVPLDPWSGQNQNDFILQEQSLLHLTKVDEKFSFSIPVFIEDTRRAFIIYQHQLVMHADENQELVKNFEKRFRRLAGRASAMVQSSDQHNK